MKTKDVKISAVYAIKVSGKIQPVRIEKTENIVVAYRGVSYTGYAANRTRQIWRGTNLATNREIYIRSAAKLRYELTLSEGKWRPSFRKVEGAA